MLHAHWDMDVNRQNILSLDDVFGHRKIGQLLIMYKILIPGQTREFLFQSHIFSYIPMLKSISYLYRILTKKCFTSYYFLWCSKATRRWLLNLWLQFYVLYFIMMLSQCEYSVSFCVSPHNRWYKTVLWISYNLKQSHTELWIGFM